MSKVIKRAKSKAGGLIPELRFPEFVEDGEWELKILGDCLLKNPEYGINAPAAPYSDKLPTYLRITDISDDGTFITRDKVSVNRNVTEDNYLSEGDIVLARTGASVGKSYKYRKKDGKLVFAGFLIRVKPDTKKIDSELLFQFLYSEQYWKWVSFISARSGQPGINGTEYASMPINLPPTIPEQQKIASCLSSLDELIAAYNDKLQALKDHKKGLMQNLFPQEGEKVPKYRFPEFENDGEWGEKELSEVAEIITGNTPSTKELKYYNGEFLFVSPADINENRYVEKTKTTLTKLGFLKTRIIKANSVMFVCIGSTIGKVGMNKYQCATNQQINSVIVDSANSSEFLYSNLELNAANIAKIAGKQAVPIINKSLFSSVKLMFPPNSNEQKKVASCFSALDELITTQSEKVEQLQSHKKGLVQGLFPKIDN